MLYILLAVFCFIVATANGSTEPVCSKFDYEVKLLEKMVRLEFQVSRMLDEIKEASKSNLDKIEALSKSVDEVSQSTTERMNNLSKSLSLDIRDLKQDVEFVYQNSNKRTILFYAHDPADTTPSAGDTLIFRKVLTNAGNGYHKSTGVFTAPESGAYVFSLQLCVDQGNSIYYEIRKEEEIISKGRAYNSTSSVCIVSVAFADLYAGDNVRAVCPYVHGDTKNVITELPVHHHSSFSAVLVN